MWLEDCCNDLFDSLEENNQCDKLELLYKRNSKNLSSVKTANGKTERINIPDVVQQGGSWGPVLCSNSTDSVGRKCESRKETFFKYKNIVRVLPLSYLDDIGGAAKCGDDSVRLNIFLTTLMESKRLKFHEGNAENKGKCYNMHVGKKKSECQKLKEHMKEMDEVDDVTYIGEILSADAKNTMNVKARVSNGKGHVNKILYILENMDLGPYYFSMAILLRNSILINGMIFKIEA